MNTATTTAPSFPSAITAPAELDPFFERFGSHLPKELREIARSMSWRTFVQTFAPTPSHRIHLEETTPRRGNHHRYAATMTTTGSRGRSTTTREIMASGPVSACTHLLADVGCRVEILSFHQMEIFQATVIFIKVCNNKHNHWAMGFGGTPEQAAAAALGSAAELLYG